MLGACSTMQRTLSSFEAKGYKLQTSDLPNLTIWFWFAICHYIKANHYLGYNGPYDLVQMIYICLPLSISAWVNAYTKHIPPGEHWSNYYFCYVVGLGWIWHATCFVRVIFLRLLYIDKSLRLSVDTCISGYWAIRRYMYLRIPGYP